MNNLAFSKIDVDGLLDYHDVNGGSPLANRVTFSVSGIYVPESNTIMLYN